MFHIRRECGQGWALLQVCCPCHTRHLSEEVPSFLSFPRQKREELARRVAEERSRREEEARRLEAEQARKREELALRLAEEERERWEREEVERAQKQVWTSGFAGVGGVVSKVSRVLGAIVVSACLPAGEPG